MNYDQQNKFADLFANFLKKQLIPKLFTFKEIIPILDKMVLLSIQQSQRFDRNLAFQIFQECPQDNEKIRKKHFLEMYFKTIDSLTLELQQLSLHYNQVLEQKSLNEEKKFQQNSFQANSQIVLDLENLEVPVRNERFVVICHYGRQEYQTSAIQSPVGQILEIVTLQYLQISDKTSEIMISVQLMNQDQMGNLSHFASFNIDLQSIQGNQKVSDAYINKSSAKYFKLSYNIQFLQELEPEMDVFQYDEVLQSIEENLLMIKEKLQTLQQPFIFLDSFDKVRTKIDQTNFYEKYYLFQVLVSLISLTMLISFAKPVYLDVIPLFSQPFFFLFYIEQIKKITVKLKFHV